MHDPRMSGVWRACIELDLPVIAHAGPAKNGSQYATPEAFGPVLDTFPGLRLVLAHMGGGSWRQIPDARAQQKFLILGGNALAFLGEPGL